MSPAKRPRVAILGRFTESASAIRYKGVISARELLELVWAAGGEPVQYLPVPDRNWDQERGFIDAVLLAGGGDIDPARYGGHAHPEVYDVDPLQDSADFELATWALANSLPVFGVCRGLHILNVLRGGTLVEHMDAPHRHVLHHVNVAPEAGLGISGDVEISCYHHQAIRELGDGMEATVTSGDSVIEAVIIDAPSWCRGVQWHPEDTWRTDPQQMQLMRDFLNQV